jgi:SAM-dependent methyltransferase
MRSPAYELTRCIVCGESDCEEIASAAQVREEVEALWAFHSRRLRGGTPPEHLMDRVAFSQEPPLRVVRCRDCGLVYRNPIEREFELRETYADDVLEPDVLRSLFETQSASYRAQVRRLTRVHGRPGSGLEVGSYVGAFLAAARESGWRFEGLDINPHTNAFARSRGFHVEEGTLETHATSRRYDAVTIWNCFDQLPDPRAAARAAHRLLVDGGVLAVRIPNGDFYAAMRPGIERRSPTGAVARALLAHNNLLSFPYRFGFTGHALGRLLRECGFAVTRVHGDTLVPIADRWTRRWAAIEEWLVKRTLRALVRGGRLEAPWIEVYARRA